MNLARSVIAFVLIMRCGHICAKPTSILLQEQSFHQHAPIHMRSLIGLDRRQFHLVSHQDDADYVLTLYPQYTIAPLNYSSRSKKNTLLYKATAKLLVRDPRTKAYCTTNFKAKIVHIYPPNSQFDQDLLQTKTKQLLSRKLTNTLAHKLNHHLIKHCDWEHLPQDL